MMMKIHRLEKFSINGSEQWVLVRGNNGDAPLLIQVQAGPGLPMIPEADAMEKMHHLEDHFLVAYWDQRGCGKSFSKHVDARSITLSQLSRDIIACTESLLQRYGKRNVTISGYSIGATLSLMAAVERKDLFSALFLSGIDVDVASANVFAIDFAMRKASEIGNRKMQLRLDNLSRTQIVDAKRFQQRARILTDMGGIKADSTYSRLALSSFKNMLLSKSYTLVDVLNTLRGMRFCQNALLNELDTLNLFKRVSSVDVPVHFIHGKNDGVSPLDTAFAFYIHLHAPQKTFTTFEKSTHMPHYDEPEKFAAQLIRALFPGISEPFVKGWCWGGLGSVFLQYVVRTIFELEH
jgi:pimeloyl-ACP methyl ester carboxylesterase